MFMLLLFCYYTTSSSPWTLAIINSPEQDMAGPRTAARDGSVMYLASFIRDTTFQRELNICWPFIYYFAIQGRRDDTTRQDVCASVHCWTGQKDAISCSTHSFSLSIHLVLPRSKLLLFVVHSNYV